MCIALFVRLLTFQVCPVWSLCTMGKAHAAGSWGHHVTGTSRQAHVAGKAPWGQPYTRCDWHEAIHAPMVIGSAVRIHGKICLHIYR